MIKKWLVFLLLLLVCVDPVFAAEDVDDYPVAPNFKGLSGYYYVDSVQTLQKGEVQGSLFGAAFKDDASSYKKGTAEAVLSAGILNGIEGSLVVPYFVQSENQNGLGDVKVAGKIHLINQIDEDIPALALAASLELPTGDQNKGLRTVNNYGVDLLLIAQSKIDLPDYSFNLVAEGGVFGQDLSQSTQERHARFGAAGYFPLDDHWILILEGIGTSGYGDSQDYAIASGSLRLFMKKFTLTGGIDRSIAVGKNALSGNNLHAAINLPF
jgi:hypothetical protein